MAATTSISPSGRALAFATLVDLERSGRPADDLLAARINRGQLEKRETALAQALIQGCLRQRGLLDAVIEHFSTVPLARIQKKILTGLRLAVYQLLFMDRIPDHAAINETIRLLKRSRTPRHLIGFVNGLLRAVCRAREAGSLPPPMADWQRLSHPRWLVRRWQQRYGREKTEILCTANNCEPPLSVTVLSGSRATFISRLAKEGIAAVPGRYTPDSVLIHDHGGSPVLLPGFADGLFQVQDQGALLICHLLASPTPVRVLDACAGVGGKAIALCRLLPGSSTITALEPNNRRFALLKENLNRTGRWRQIRGLQTTLQEFAERHDGPKFDAILLDVPCSGLGVIRRHPEIRWLRREKDLLRYQARQQELLFAAADLLAAGGTLLYGTCSTEPEENDRVVSAFLDQHRAYRIVDARSVLPEQAHGTVDADGLFRTLPDSGETDGFFAARICKAAA